MKTKIILKSNTIVFDPFNLFVFVNICLLVLFKKFNMDITEKMVSFQIIQNVINVKTTLACQFIEICNQMEVNGEVSNFERIFFI